MLSQGDIIGDKYEIISKIKRGGMGDIYLGREIQTGRKVVVKHPLVGTKQDFTNLEKLKQEAEVLKDLSHPNIVKYVDFLDDGPFLVLEYVKGKSLEEIYQGRKAGQEVFEIARQIIEAAEYLHEKGHVHRDICPQNVLLNEICKATLIDFGTASREFRAATGTKITHGLYTAPELANEGRFDKRSDLYSIGATIYFLLTGRHPDTIPPRSVGDGKWDSIMGKATRIEPEMRYGSAREILDELLALGRKTIYIPALTVTNTKNHSAVGKIFELQEDSIIIGRGDEADFRIPDEKKYLSSKHGRIFKKGEKWFIEDLGSVNGTFVNKKKLARGEQVKLEDGDEIWLCFNEKKPSVSPYIEIKFEDMLRRMEHLLKEMRKIEVEFIYDHEVPEDEKLELKLVLRNYSEVAWEDLTVDLSDASCNFSLKNDKALIKKLSPGEEKILKFDTVPTYLGCLIFTARIFVGKEHLLDKEVEVEVGGEAAKKFIKGIERGTTLIWKKSIIEDKEKAKALIESPKILKAKWFSEILSGLKLCVEYGDWGKCMSYAMTARDFLDIDASSGNFKEYIKDLNQLVNHLDFAKKLDEETKEKVQVLCGALSRLYGIK